MRQAARVSSINALKDFKRALGSFATVINTALAEAQSDLQRTTWWVQQDRVTHWQAQKRKRTTQLAQANSELFRAQVASPDQRVPATLERKAVDQAQQRLDEAETKLASIKRRAARVERPALRFAVRARRRPRERSAAPRPTSLGTVRPARTGSSQCRGSHWRGGAGP